MRLVLICLAACEACACTCMCVIAETACSNDLVCTVSFVQVDRCCYDFVVKSCQ